MQGKLPGKQSLADRLKWVRSRQGLTLQAFADQVLYDKSYISRLESGSSLNPSARFLTAVASRFGVSFAWLESGLGTAKAEPEAAAPQSKLPEEETDFLNEFLERFEAVEFLRILAGHSSMPQLLKASTELMGPGKLRPENATLWTIALTRALFNATENEQSLLEKAAATHREELEKLLTPEFIVGATRRAKKTK